MDLLQLRYFYDSTNYMSISKTAEKYKVPPSSVSASIRRLEKELGVKLFNRSANRITLNDKGKIVCDSLKRIFDEMDYMLQKVSDTTADTKEIKILVKAVRTWVTERIIQYKNKYTNTRFELIVDFDETDFGNYDIIIDVECDQYVGYEAVKLCKQQLFLYAAVDSEFGSRRLSIKDFAEEPFVVMSRQGYQGKLLSAACKKAGFSPNIVAQVNDSGCFRKMISSGIAIGVGGELAGNESMIALNVTDFRYEQAVCMYYKKENNHGNTARFLAFILDNKNNQTGNHGIVLCNE